MILPKPEDSVHASWMFRILSGIADDAFLAAVLRFKGGTYASMRGLIGRFSVDLDFDLLDGANIPMVRKNLENIFKKIELTIKERGKRTPQYFLKYHTDKEGRRSTLKIDITSSPPKNNQYEPVRFIEIDRILHGHTVPTLFANKLTAPLDRFKRHHSVAGRDFFDLHAFFMNGLGYNPDIIVEKTGYAVPQFLKVLLNFAEQHVTQTLIDQDLNHLLPYKDFLSIRKILKQELIMFLRDEIKRVDLQ